MSQASEPTVETPTGPQTGRAVEQAPALSQVNARPFGAPLGAALLAIVIGAGILTFARAVAFLSVAQSAHAVDSTVIVLFGLGSSTAFYAALAGAAGICFRDMRRLVAAVGLGLLLGLLRAGVGLAQFLLPKGNPSFSFSTVLTIQFVGAAIIGGLLGYGTAWLFGKRSECGWIALAVGIVSGLVAKALPLVVWAAPSTPPEAFDALSVTLNVLTGLILLLPVAAYLEHCMIRERRQGDAQASS